MASHTEGRTHALFENRERRTMFGPKEVKITGDCRRLFNKELYDLYSTPNTGLFISPSGISELDCATTKTDTAEMSISIGRESLQVSVLPYRCSICAPLVTRQMSIL